MPYGDTQAQREYQRQWMARRRAAFFADKRCKWCSDADSLELHHRDPNVKENHKIWSWSAARREVEVAKCIVLCQSCHRRAHSEVRRLEAELRNPHGTRNRYELGCHCADCRRGKCDYERARRERAA